MVFPQSSFENNESGTPRIPGVSQLSPRTNPHLPGTISPTGVAHVDFSIGASSPSSKKMGTRNNPGAVPLSARGLPSSARSVMVKRTVSPTHTSSKTSLPFSDNRTQSYDGITNNMIMHTPTIRANIRKSKEGSIISEDIFNESLKRVLLTDIQTESKELETSEMDILNKARLKAMGLQDQEKAKVVEVQTDVAYPEALELIKEFAHRLEKSENLIKQLKKVIDLQHQKLELKREEEDHQASLMPHLSTQLLIGANTIRDNALISHANEKLISEVSELRGKLNIVQKKNKTLEKALKRQKRILEDVEKKHSEDDEETSSPQCIQRTTHISPKIRQSFAPKQSTFRGQKSMRMTRTGSLGIGEDHVSESYNSIHVVKMMEKTQQLLYKVYCKNILNIFTSIHAAATKLGETVGKVSIFVANPSLQEALKDAQNDGSAMYRNDQTFELRGKVILKVFNPNTLNATNTTPIAEEPKFLLVSLPLKNRNIMAVPVGPHTDPPDLMGSSVEVKSNVKNEEVSKISNEQKEKLTKKEKNRDDKMKDLWFIIQIIRKEEPVHTNLNHNVSVTFGDGGNPIRKTQMQGYGEGPGRKSHFRSTTVMKKKGLRMTRLGTKNLEEDSIDHEEESHRPIVGFPDPFCAAIQWLLMVSKWSLSKWVDDSRVEREISKSRTLLEMIETLFHVPTWIDYEHRIKICIENYFKSKVRLLLVENGDEILLQDDKKNKAQNGHAINRIEKVTGRGILGKCVKQRKIIRLSHMFTSGDLDVAVDGNILFPTDSRCMVGPIIKPGDDGKCFAVMQLIRARDMDVFTKIDEQDFNCTLTLFGAAGWALNPPGSYR